MGYLQYIFFTAIITTTSLFTHHGHCNSDYQSLVSQRKAQDPRTFREIKLNNGLPVMLVQDQRNKNAYASMNVGVGSLADPKDQRGLAHFLEHLLFLGSEKFPEVDSYSRYLADNGGSSNAFTSRTDTNYHLSVSGEALDGALDRFAQFFISPLLNSKYVDREKNAIEKEYMRFVENDGWRGFRARMLAMNPEHPHSWYFPGNLESLQNVERKDALRFYAKYYSASNMNLVIIGPQNLDELEKMARSYFSEIKNNGAQEYKIPDNVFNIDKLPKKITVKSFSNQHSLAIHFILPYDQDYESKSTHLLTSILGTESQGSLTSYLKSQGLILGLTAGGGASDNYNTLSLSVRLTGKGSLNKDKVIQSVFDYIRLIRKNGLPQNRLNKQRELLVQQFLEEPFSSSVDYAVSLTQGMKNFPGEYALAKSKLIKAIDLDKIKTILDSLRVDNMLITELDPSLATTQIDEDYKLPYTKQHLSKPEFLELLDFAERSIPDALNLPNENPYFSQKNPLLTRRQDQTLKLSKSQPGIKFSLMKDSEFEYPHVNIHIRFMFPSDDNSPLSIARKSLAAQTLGEFLNEVSYEGLEAGYEYAFTVNSHESNMVISGPSANISNYLQKLFNKISEPISNDIYLTLAKEKISEDYHSLDTRAPLNTAFEIFSSKINNQPRLSSYYSHIEDINLADIQNELENIIFKSFKDVALQGNLNNELAEKIKNIIYQKTVNASTLPSKPVSPELSYPQNMSESPMTIREEVISENYGFLYSLTLDGLDKGEVAALNIVSQFIGQQYLTEMRTNKGLAYAIGGASPTIQGSSVLYLFMQSDSPVELLLDETMNWIPTLTDTLKNLDEANFQAMRQALLNRLKNPPQNFNQKWEEAIEIWQHRHPLLLKADRIQIIEEAQLSDLHSVTQKLETLYDKNPIIIGVWRKRGASEDLPLEISP